MDLSSAAMNVDDYYSFYFISVFLTNKVTNSFVRFESIDMHFTYFSPHVAKISSF